MDNSATAGTVKTNAADTIFFAQNEVPPKNDSAQKFYFMTSDILTIIGQYTNCLRKSKAKKINDGLLLLSECPALHDMTIGFSSLTIRCVPL
jgi:hypothetical protein